MSNRYLQGFFAPMHEELTLTDLDVAGTIPDYLDGRYLRNGPNPDRRGRSRSCTTGSWATAWCTASGSATARPSGTATAGCADPRRRRAWASRRRPGHFGVSDLGANTNVIAHAGKTLALVEGGASPTIELTDELDTVGVCDFDGTLTGGYTAHPKRDPETGELHAVSYSLTRGNTVQYSVIGADGRARRTVDIEVHGSPMMHDFSLTERYVVFYDLPVTFDAGWQRSSPYRAGIATGRATGVVGVGRPGQAFPIRSTARGRRTPDSRTGDALFRGIRSTRPASA